MLNIHSYYHIGIKNLGLFFFFTILMNCTEITRIPSISNFNQSNISPLYTNRNGYDKKECDYGCFSSNDDYYKLVFLTQKHGIWVTKHALSILDNWDFASDRPDIRPIHINWAFETVIYHGKDRDKLIYAMKKSFECEFKHFVYNKINGCLWAAAGIWFMKNNELLRLKKNEYDNWMKKHPETKILKY